MDFDRATLKRAGESRVGWRRKGRAGLVIIFSIWRSRWVCRWYLRNVCYSCEYKSEAWQGGGEVYEGVGWQCFRALVPARDAFPRASFTPAAPKTDARSSFVNFPRQELRLPDKAPSVLPSRSATLHGKGENKTERGKSVSMDRYELTFRRSTLSTQGIDDAFRVKHVCDTGITNSFGKRIVRYRFVRRIYFIRVEAPRRSARVSESRVRSGITLLPKSTDNGISGDFLTKLLRMYIDANTGTGDSGWEPFEALSAHRNLLVVAAF